MIRSHTFRGYADHPDMCVAELDNGDTCNAEMSEHAHTEEQPTTYKLEVLLSARLDGDELFNRIMCDIEQYCTVIEIAAHNKEMDAAQMEREDEEHYRRMDAEMAAEVAR